MIIIVVYHTKVTSGSSIQGHQAPTANLKPMPKTDRELQHVIDADRRAGRRFSINMLLELVGMKILLYFSINLVKIIEV